jgi:3-oxoacyl-(acyl-carrier-protein) synthase
MGRVHDFDVDRELSEVPARFRAQYPRELRLYLASLYLARNDADLDLSRLDSVRVGLYDGAARSTFASWWERFHELADGHGASKYTRRDLMTGLTGQTVGIAASLFGTRGPAYCFAGTCSSGAMAIGHAYREIVLGEIDVDGLVHGNEGCTASAPPSRAPFLCQMRDGECQRVP